MEHYNRLSVIKRGALLCLGLVLVGCEEPSARPPVPPLTGAQQAELDKATRDLIKTAGSSVGRFQFLIVPDVGIAKGDTMTGEVWICGGAQGVAPHWIKLPETT